MNILLYSHKDPRIVCISLPFCDHPLVQLPPNYCLTSNSVPGGEGGDWFVGNDFFHTRGNMGNLPNQRQQSVTSEILWIWVDCITG